MDFLTMVQKEIVLFDGAMGTMLMQAGLIGGACPELWNREHPDIVRQIHAAYFDAGSRVVETNSFGGTSLKLDSYGLGGQAFELNKLAANLACDVRPEGCFVAGSIGPTGQFLSPLGHVDDETMYAAFKEQVLGLVEGGADILCIETMMDIAETTIAIRAARENTDLPIIATMTFNTTDRGFFTMMGNTPEQAAKELPAAGADIIGANCGNGPQEMVHLVPLFSAACDVPLLFQSNAGLPQFIDGETVYSMGPDEYAVYMRQFIDSGARLIGGCCGTTPVHISAIHHLLGL